MSELQKKEGDHGIVQSPESKAIQAPDAQAARNAGMSDIKAAQALNQNAHNGGAGGDQNLSFELVAVRDGKSKVVAARQPERLESISMEELISKGRSGDKFAVSLVQQMRATADLPEEQRIKVKTKLQDTADKMYGRSAGEGSLSEQSKRSENIDTQTMKALAPSNEVARSALEMRESIEKHVPAGPERDKLIAQLKADVTPVLQGHIEQNVQKQQEPNEWEAFNKLEPKQQRAVIEAFQTGSNIGQETYEKKIQAVAESVPHGFYNVGKSLYDTGIAAGTFVIESAQRPEKVPEAARKLAGSLAEAIAGGAKISQFVAGQAQEMAKTGNYSPAVEGLKTIAEAANERWEAMPLEKRTEKGSELIADMGIGSVVGGADRLAKSGKLIDALEDVAKHLKDLSAPGRDKAKQAIGAFLDDLFQPKGVTTNGFEMPIPKPPRDIDDLVMLKNKGLPDNIKPSEKVTTTRRRDFDGQAVHVLEVPETVFEAAEKRGITRPVVQEKLDKIANSLNYAYNKLGDYNPRKHGSERSYGTKLHELLRQKLGTDDLLHTEASYKKGLPVPWGKLGSSRVDIALGEHDKPFASMCLKTLRAAPSAQQERGWYNNLPRFDDSSVVPRIYFKLGK